MAAPDRNPQQGTNLTTWDPLEEFQRLTSQLSRFPDSWDVLRQLPQGFIPKADVEETDDAYVADVELPGVDRKYIDVALEGRRLIVTGERKEKEREGILRRRTRSVGRFYFDIQLPGDVDPNGVSANLHDGVLAVRVPKAKNTQPKHIEVK